MLKSSFYSIFRHIKGLLVFSIITITTPSCESLKNITEKNVAELSRDSLASLTVNQRQLENLTESSLDTGIHDSWISKLPATILVSIAVFIIGQFLIWRRRQINIKNEVEAYRYTVLEWAKQVDKNIRSQATYCDKFSNAAENSKEIQQESLKHTPLNVNRLTAISTERYINTFAINSTGERSENYENAYQLIRNLELLELLFKESEWFYRKYEENIFSSFESWNKEFKELSDLISNHLDSDDGTPSHLRTDIRDVVLKWKPKAEEIKKALDTERELVLPILKLLERHFKSVGQTNEFILVLYSKLETLKIILMQWKEYKNGVSKLFQNQSKKYINTANAVRECIAYFEKHTKTKGIWKIK